MGFYKEDHAARRSLTHTLAYAYQGLFGMRILFNRAGPDIDSSHCLATDHREVQLQPVFFQEYTTPNGRGLEKYSCPHGELSISRNLALNFYKYYNDELFLKAGKKAIDQGQKLSNTYWCEMADSGGIAGSRPPIWEDIFRTGTPMGPPNFSLMPYC